jgi:GntP family gluconate:H+ symporter
MQIYWGAVPFVLIQIVMVGLIIAFPGIVAHDKQVLIDLDKVKIEMPDSPGMGTGVNPFAVPAPGGLQPEPMPGAPSAADAERAAAEEQKKLDDLFKK